MQLKALTASTLHVGATLLCLFLSNRQVPADEQSDATVSDMATVLYLGIAENESIEFAFKEVGLLTLDDLLSGCIISKD